jgi:hypothetical protein
MRTSARLGVALIGLSAAIAGAVAMWRRNPRVGTSFVNSVVNPVIVRRGLAGRGRAEIGTLEHTGRTSGIRRVTPVHPEATRDGFRILVPLGEHSEWAHNVMAAGHCRLQLHDLVYELDEPALVPAPAVDGLPRPIAAVMSALGIEYLTLRTFGSTPGALEPTDAEELMPGEPAPARIPAEEVGAAPVSVTA